MSAVPSASSLARTVHQISMAAVRCTVAITRDAAGAIVGLEAIEADPKRRGMIEAAGRGLASGKSATEGVLTMQAMHDLYLALVRIERGAA